MRTRGDELRGDGTDHALLGQIAAATDGHVLTSLTRVFVDRPAPTYSYRGLWRELLLASMLLMLASVALRRLIMPRELLDATLRLVPASVRARFVRRPRAVSSEAGATALDALTASARERRAAREPALEITAAQQARGEAEVRATPAGSPWTGTPEPKPSTPAEASSKADAPRSLAENLVARRRKKK